jgi:hypothetical protein
MLIEGVMARLKGAAPKAQAAPVVCIGHSHVNCVAMAAALEDFPLRVINFWVTPEPFVERDGRRRFAPKLTEALGGDVVSFIGGSAHIMVGLPQHPRPFDFILPSAPDLPLDAAAEIIPVDGVRAAMMSFAQEYLDLIGQLKTAPGQRVWHAAPPPPYADGAAMAPLIPWGMFEAGPHQVSPKFLRYKMWRLHCEILEGFCQDAGVGFIPHPTEAVDEEGFLLADCYEDPGHANLAYGRLVLEQVRRRLA